MHRFKRIIEVVDLNETNCSVNGMERHLYRVTVEACKCKTRAGISTAKKSNTSHKVWEAGHVPQVTDWKKSI